MGPIHRIVAASDFSTRADLAPRRAAALSHPKLAQLAHILGIHYGLKVGHHVSVGSAHVEIVAYAIRRNADLIVLGAHGENFVRDLFLGATASKVVRKAACPVLIVRTAAAEPYRKILVGVDASPAAEDALHFALRLAPDAELCAMHVVERAGNSSPTASCWGA
ncbi:MAG: universal stress protein [Pseudomonadota bacterium]|jgi:nucleotide-binding universal stress UspA family protein